MSDFELGPTGDWVVRNGQIPLVRGRDATAQLLLTRLRSVRGEWRQDRRVGVPYYESILGNPDPQVVRAVLHRVVRETPGVTSVQTLELEHETTTREMFVSIEATDDNGESIVITHEPLIV